MQTVGVAPHLSFLKYLSEIRSWSRAGIKLKRYVSGFCHSSGLLSCCGSIVKVISGTVMLPTKARLWFRRQTASSSDEAEPLSRR